MSNFYLGICSLQCMCRWYIGYILPSYREFQMKMQIRTRLVAVGGHLIGRWWWRLGDRCEGAFRCEGGRSLRRRCSRLRLHGRSFLIVALCLFCYRQHLEWITLNRLFSFICIYIYIICICIILNHFGMFLYLKFEFSDKYFRLGRKKIEILPGAGCISLKGTSATSSPPIEPILHLTRATYEMTKPVAETLFSAVAVDEARLTSSS